MDREAWQATCSPGGCKGLDTTEHTHTFTRVDFPGGSDGKVSTYNVGDPDSIPGLGRSPGEGNGNPHQYSCLENPVEEGT